ncbi:hypothetical protein MIS45_05500 [Wielerella bovis]|nr:hypothetical protein [Wielerella bovis]ULJ63507.1 hypothetical protein MIS46_05545 [Wielerella bovis]ULJ70276.1 hypothetical protein MIS45_05500 [Wielerella bovis]
MLEPLEALLPPPELVDNDKPLLPPPPQAANSTAQAQIVNFPKNRVVMM